jgi:transcriptional regulator with XRE-family HTH domain
MFSLCIVINKNVTLNELDEIFSDNVGILIRKHRKSKGLSIEALAQICEMNYTQISRIERGIVNCNLNSIGRIMWALEIDAADIIPTYSEKPPKMP